MKPGEIYQTEHDVAKAAAGDVDLEGPEIPEGLVVRIEAFYAIDLTTANKTIRLGYEKAGVKYWFKRAAPGSGIYGISQDRPIILVEGEKPIARIESATAADQCTLLVRGIYL